MMKVFQMKRGDIANLPTLRDGELALVYEGNSAWVYVGTKSKENKKLWQLESTRLKEFITQFDNSATTFNVEEAWDLNEIKDYAFYKNNFESLGLDFISKIGQYAFYEGEDIVELFLSNTLEEVGQYAFYNLINAKPEDLPTRAFPKSLKEVEQFAFYRLGKNSGQAFDVEFEEGANVGTSGFQEAKIKNLRGFLKNLGDNAFRDLGSSLEEIDIHINGDIGQYALAGNTTAMFKFHKDSILKKLSTYGMQNFGVNRPDPEANRIDLDWRKSRFTELPNYFLSGSSSSNRPKYFDVRLPKSLDTIGTYVFRYAQYFDVFLHSVPALTNVNAFDGAENFNIYAHYTISEELIQDTNWASLEEHIYGIAVGDEFGLGEDLPTHNKITGRPLKWYSDKEMTNQIYVVTDVKDIYYALEEGTREVYYLEMTITEVEAEIKDLTDDVIYTKSALVPVGNELKIIKADPIGDADIKAFTINGLEASVGDEFTMNQDHTVKVFAFSGEINYDFTTAEPFEIKLAAEAGIAYNYEIGSTRPITLKNDVPVTLQVLENRNNILKREDGTYNGLVIGLVELLPDRARMNPSSTNSGGWNATEMRTETMEDIFELLPDEWQEIISTSQIRTMNGRTSSSTVVTSMDKLFIPAAKEVLTERPSYVAEEEWDELETFLYYVENDQPADRQKTRVGETSPEIWWLRSVSSYGSNYFYGISSSGFALYYYAGYSYGVAVCFAI